MNESYSLLVTQCFFGDGKQSNMIFMSDLIVAMSSQQYITATLIRCVL